MAEAFVEDEFGGHAAVLESAIEFPGIRDRDASVAAALLDERGRVRVIDVSDGRSLFVDFRIAPGSAAKILARERSDVGIDVVGHPVRNAGADGHGAELVAESSDEGGDVAAFAPAHGADALGVNVALRN